MDELTGKRVIILGLARQGKALARFAATVGARVTISDLQSPEALQPTMEELSDLSIEYVLGEHPMSLLEDADIMAISGAVPADAPIVAAARARGIAITNDSVEFMKRTPADVIGITGSAGKTTTTALTGVMGQVAGRRTWIGGNIGRPLIADLHKMRAEDLVVQELSSFQLEIMTQSPPIAAVLNVTPNHLDRHKTLSAYANAKANILRYQSADGVAVLSADNPGALALQNEVRGRLRLFSLRWPVKDGAFVHKGQIWLRDGDREMAVCALEDIPLRGWHNVLNVLAAVTLADSASIPVEAMRQAIRTFNGIEHRLELVATVDNVHYVNDSIATAPERAIAAIDSFDEPLILLAGGRDKNLEWDEWARRVRQRVKTVVLFGELADLLESHLFAQDAILGRASLSEADNQRDQALSQIIRVDTAAEAVAAAAGIARADDVVLFSPGGTSFDAFADFAERGEAFRQLVQELESKHV